MGNPPNVANTNVSSPAVQQAGSSQTAGISEKLTLIHAAMGLDDSVDIATGIETLNQRLGLPATVRELGYEGSDIETLTRVTIDSHFNLSAPVLPNDEEFQRIVEKVLG